MNIRGILLISLLSIWSVLHAQDVSINILGLSPSVPLNTNGLILVDVCNNDGGNTNLEVNRIRPTIEFPASHVGMSVVPIINNGFILISNNGTTIVYENTIQIPPGECLQIIVGYTGVNPGGPEIVTGTIVFNGGPTTGNLPGNDVSTTSITVLDIPFPNITVSKTADRAFYGMLGETITYEIIVSNTGNITLSDVQVVDNLTNDQFFLDSLVMGDADTFFVSYIVMQEDIDRQFVENTVIATGVDTTGMTITDNDMARVDLDPNAFLPNIMISKTSNSMPFSMVGEEVQYSLAVTNNGNVTLTNVVVRDSLTGDEFFIDTLLVGQNQSFSVTYVVTQMDFDEGVIVNIATVVAEDPNGNPIVDEDDETLIRNPDAGMAVIGITKIASQPLFSSVGQVVTYIITIENQGNLTLSNIEVTDDLTGDIFNVDTLMVGASESFTVMYTITAVDFLGGIVTNVATVEAEDPQGNTILNSDIETIQLDPNAIVAQFATEKVADVEFFGNVGQVINYTITVSNAGNVPLNNVLVVDDLTGDEFSIAVLGVGMTEMFSTMYTVTQMDFDHGFITNVVQVTGEDPNGNPVADDATATVIVDPSVFNPDLLIVKVADRSTFLEIGEEIQYTITASNIGNVTLVNLSIIDNLTGDVFQLDTLSIGQIVDFTVSYIVQSSDFNIGFIENIATGSAITPGGIPVSDSDTARVDVDPNAANPQISIEKVADRLVFSAVGEVINYELVVLNSGNLPLVNVVVEDELTGDVFTLNELGVGEQGVFMTSYLVTQNDFELGLITNIATVTATASNLMQVMDSDEATVTREDGAINAAFTTVKQANKNFFTMVGEIVQYNISVANSGNVTISNILVVDDLTGDQFMVDQLMVGQIVNFSVSYTITQADMDRGFVLNTVLVTGQDPMGNPVTDEDDEFVPLDPNAFNPQFTITKMADRATYSMEGEVITYTITVTNSGNVTLSNVVVSDDLTGDTFTVGQLGVGMSQVFTVTYTVTVDDLNNASIVNVALVSGDDPNGDPVNEDVEEQVDNNANAAIVISKTAINNTFSFVGETINYTITVTNTGTVNLSNLVITDPLIGFTQGLSSLTVGSSVSYGVSYSITLNDLMAGFFNNTAFVEAMTPIGGIVQDQDSEIVTCSGVDFASLVPADITISCDVSVPPFQNNFNGLCGIESVEVNDIAMAGSCQGNSTVQRTFTVTFSSGMMQTFTQNIFIFDSESPTFTTLFLPRDITVDCGAIPLPVELSAVDNCSTPQVTFSESSLSESGCNSGQMIIRTWIATDACGNSTSHTQTITVIDNTSPIITITNTFYSQFTNGTTIDIACQSNTPGWGIPELDGLNDAIATDGCSEVVSFTFEAMNEGGNCLEDGFLRLFTYRWEASDACGNTSLFTLRVRVLDNTPPVLVGIPADITISCAQVPAPPSIGSCLDGQECCPENRVVAIDECECAEVYFEEVTGDICGDTYNVFRIWTAVDNCGNMSRDTQVITVIKDFTQGVSISMNEPNLIGLAPNSILEFECTTGESLPNWLLNLDANSISVENACFGVQPDINFLIIDVTPINNNCLISGFVKAYEFGWFIHDGCETIQSLEFRAFVRDTKGPEILLVPQVCDENEATAVASDGCGEGEVQLTFTDQRVQAICGSGFDTQRTWRATDACGNVTTSTQIILNPAISLADAIILNPNLNGNDVIVMDCEDTFFAGTLSGFQPTDVRLIGRCGNILPVEFSETMIGTGDCANGGSMLYRVMVEWSAPDLCGERVSFRAEVVVMNSSGPVFEGNNDFIDISCGDDFFPTVIGTCSEVVRVDMISETMIPIGDCASQLVMERVYEAEDACGIVRTGIYVVRINRDKGVKFVGLEDDLILCETATPTVTAIDQCTGDVLQVTMVETRIMPQCGQGGEWFRRIWSTQDSCGERYEFIQTVVKNDVVPPIVNIFHPSYGPVTQGDIFDVDCNADVDFLSMDFIQVVNECDFDLQVFQTEDINLNCSVTKVSKVVDYTVIASDPCGNTAQVTFKVRVSDKTPPIWTSSLPEDVSLCGSLPPIPSLNAADNCSDVSINFTEILEAVSEFEVSWLRRWTATDECGNSTTHNQSITVSRGENFKCQIEGDLTPNCNSKGNTLNVLLSGATEGPKNYRWEVLGGICFITSGQGTPSITYDIGFSNAIIRVIVTDANGCQTECTVQINCGDRNINGNASEGTDESPIIVYGGLYPNPTSWDAYLKLTSDRPSTGEVLIYDMYGTLLRKREILLGIGINEFELPVRHLPNAMYLVQVFVLGEQITVKPLVITR